MACRCTGLPVDGPATHSFFSASFSDGVRSGRVRWKTGLPTRSFHLRLPLLCFGPIGPSVNKRGSDEIGDLQLGSLSVYVF